MRIAIFELGKAGMEYIKPKLKGHNIMICEDPLNESNVNLAKDAEVLVTFIHSKISSNEIDQLKDLKLVCTMSSGFDHIDIDYCKKRGIKVATVPDYGNYCVAEYAFALILMLSKKIYKTINFSKLGEDFGMGFDLEGKTLGIFGAGRIGINVIKIAKAFDMNILVYDPNIEDEKAKELGFKPVNIDTLLSSSDIISLHCPCDKTNYRMINMKNIRKIKKGAIFVNTARGALVDTNALIYALEKGIISGAALDVLEDEDKIIGGKTTLEYNKLLKMSNVILTYHNAYNTKESLKKIFNTTIENINGLNHNVH